VSEMTKSSTRAVPQSNNALLSIQVMRGLAALMVVVCHVFDNIDPVLISPVVRSTNGSILNFGVDLFFVISGFIMVYTTMGRPLGMKQFMVARITRIVPLYWLTLLATVGVLALTGGRVPILAEVIQAAFFIPYQDPATGAYLPFLPVGWTLSYEMVFYLIFAATIAIGRVRQVVVISLIFTLFVAARLILNPESAIGFRLTSPLFFEFTMGMVVAMAWPMVRTFGLRWAGPALLASGIAALLVMHPLHVEMAFPRFIAYGGPAALVVAGGLLLEPWFAVKPFAPFRALGDMSYSLYLSHALPLLVLPALLPAAMPYWGKTVLLTGVCIVVGSLCYWHVERLLQLSLRALTARKRRHLIAT